MRPHPVLRLSLWAALVLTLNADSENSTEGCVPQIKVRRDTAYETLPGRDLDINCPVDFCNASAAAVTWHKSEGNRYDSVIESGHITTKWTQLSDNEGVSFLIFRKILRSDSGFYLCRMGDNMGHFINVSVLGDGEEPWNNISTSTPSSPEEPPQQMWLYAYPAAGVVGLVTTVIVMTLVSMRWCKGKSKKEPEREIEYAEIPMVKGPFPRGGPRPSPTASPSAPPSRFSQPEDPQADALSPPREPARRKGRVDGERRGNAAEVGSGVVYAALRHQLPPGAAPRARRQEECSEYAAIRVA